MSDENPYYRRQAEQHFEQARGEARRRQLAARLAGREDHLLPFDEIRSRLRQQNPIYKGVQNIPLAKIAGSVGRYREFSRTFMPLNDSFRDRWITVETLGTSRGWHPIEVYRVGDVYFVLDGNHRVAIAQQLHMDTIEAHVHEFPNAIDIEAGDDLDTILIRLGERNFMDRTELDKRQPDHGIRFTVPGRYDELLAQIESLRETLALIDGEKMAYHEAVDAWYEMVYLPTVQIIRSSSLLATFPGRTEADLFAWLSSQRTRLADYYGDYDNLADLAETLAERHREGTLGKMTRRLRQLLGQDILPPLSDEPPAR